ncbi:MAG: type I glutamate--ammonia ligase [Planctomycetota bacterium]
MSPKEVLAKIKALNIRAVDVRFSDMFGMWHHFTLPTTMVNEASFTEGHGFDGSSIRGWKAIDESDMLVVPDADTAVIDPFFAEPTMTLIANVVDPITKEDYARDPRGVARRVEQYLHTTGIGDTMYVGPEPEFFIFDSVHWDNNPQSAYYAIESDEGPWNTGVDGANLGFRPRLKGGYLPVPPVDQLQDLRGEMMRTMEDVGIEMERQHHEVAGGGQAEIDMKYDSLVSMADKLQWFKYIVRQCAVRSGKTATFMPKPIFGDNGSGMHCHFSIWKNKTNLFAGSGYAGLSDTGRWAIGGLLRHAHAIIAFTNPTTNSYRRLVPHFEAPIKLAYSSRNRSAAIRIPMFSSSPASKRFEFRCPDPLACGYLAFSAIAMACLDGIQNRIDPGDPLDKNIYDLPPEEMAQVVDAPTSLESALAALEKDHEFLLRGDVFSTELIESYIKYKHDNEVLIMKTRPHPLEFAMYYDG